MLKLVNISLGIIILLLQAKLFFGESSIFTLLDYNKKIKIKTEEVNQIETRNNTLMQNINYIKNNPEAIEELARYELGMIKSQETYYQVIEPVE